MTNLAHRMKKVITCLSFVMLLAIISCAKKDIEDPTITVNQPLNNASFAYNEYIVVKGRASDETKLKTVKAELFTSTMATTGLSNEVEATSNDFDFTISVLLNDRYLSSGQYILKVTATDRSGNTKSTFKDIVYTELVRSLDDIYVISKPGGSNFQLSKVVGSGTTSVKSFQGNYKQGAANPFHQLIWLASNGSSGKLEAFDPALNETVYSESVQQVMGDFFTHIGYSALDKMTYIVSSDQRVQGKIKNGFSQVNINTLGTLVPYKIFLQGDYVFVERRQGAQREFSAFFKTTNTLYHTISLPANLAAVLRKNQNELFLITTGNGASQLHVYTISNGAVWSPISIPAGDVNDAVYIVDEEIYLAHQSGIMRYTYANNSLVTLVGGVNASQLIYDSLNSRLVAVVGNQIHFYNLQGNPAGVVTHSVNIADILLFYNK
jgi:hypothetical protein